jgi:NitT/TauT family transport system ATP-binding protein
MRLGPFGEPQAKQPHPDAALYKLYFDGVGKRFFSRGGWTHAVERFTLGVTPGEFVCLVGPSGCGKTTLLNVAAGLVKPDDGAVYVDGHPVTGPGPDRTVVFQEHALFPWMTVRKNVEFGMEMIGKARKERDVTTRFYLRLTNLAEFEDFYVHELSGGMKQRVQLARALCMNPSVLLMDEPFAALDAMTRDFLYDQVQDLIVSVKKTVLFITHNIREAVILADRVVLMTAQPGRIKADIKIDLPRPRPFDSPEVLRLTSELLKEIRTEIEKAEAEEHHAPRARGREPQ